MVLKIKLLFVVVVFYKIINSSKNRNVTLGDEKNNK